ncbi:hypothetical protein, partial [Rhizobium sp. PP-F2F-G48]|uniref:hypothetical protein n=1 Tax=Rhizobium sp. PP-F2F-G48 TaxID=2135651 RepID=UPI00140517D4
RVAAAIEGAQISHSLKLTRLVDGISTYTVTVDSETHEFVDTDTENAIDQAYAHIRAIKQRCQAEAVIAALAATEGSADV